MLNKELKNSSQRSNLLCEFLTEELPINNLHKLGQSFVQNLIKELNEFVDQTEPYIILTPRRFGVILYNVKRVAEVKQVLKRGPSIATAFKDNKPTSALLGFAKSCDINDLSDLIKSEDGYFYFEKTIPGVKLEEIIIDSIFNSCKNLPIQKSMHWGNNDFSFVRPIHNFLLVFGDKVICETKTIYGLSPNNYTYGHRYMFNDKLVIKDIDLYENILLNTGKVVTNFTNRKKLIHQQLLDSAKSINLKLNESSNLLEEVTSLVEYPVVLIGEFNLKYLKIPKECLILTMAKNQKYFALINDKDELSNKFLFISNLESKDSKIIIKGNQKVLSARLEDAKFFYDLDIKFNLEYFIDKLSTVIYHNQLGFQSDRISRIQNIALTIVNYDRNNYFNLEIDDIKRASLLIKADLTSEMVNEFPELQGVMGKHYALMKEEKKEVAIAIEQHYYPRFSNDKIPTEKLSILMALVDKLEMIVGIWYIGLVPSGDSDPYALRRAALGIGRILLENEIDLNILLKATKDVFIDQLPQINVDRINISIIEVRHFILDRLINYLVDVKSYHINNVQSIFAKKNNEIYLNYTESLLDAIKVFLSSPKNKLLLEANKRIKNILEKNSIPQPTKIIDINEDLLVVEDEKVLYNVLKKQISMIQNNLEQHRWQELFNNLSEFNDHLDTYFKNVMIMTDDIVLKNNRINLISNLYFIFNSCCELNKLILL